MNYALPNKNIFLQQAQEYLEKSRIYPEMEIEFVEKAESLVQQAKQVEMKDDVKKLKSKFSEFVIGKKPKRTFKDVGGLEQVKESVRLKIIEPLKKPEIFQYFGKKMGGGMLMYGPPGCGKSLIAEAIAGECEATFFNVKASDVKSKYVGESEQNMARLFKEAREFQPSILFFDEFESLGGDRSLAQHHDRSLVAQLLSESDGVGSKDQQLLLLAATNEPWSVDLALRREGRFGTSIFIPPPDAKAREQILMILLKEKPVSQEVNVKILALLTDGYSGADLNELCNTAIEEAIKDCLKKNKLRQIQLDDFKKVLKTKVPSCKVWLEKAVKWVKSSGQEDYFRELIDYVERPLISTSE